MFINNQKGFSLVEIIVAGAALGGLALVSLNLAKMNNKSSVKYNVDSDLRQIVNDITGVISDPTACISAFGGANAVNSTNTITNIDSQYYTKAAQPNSSYGNSNLQIDNFKLSSTDSDVVDHETSYLIVSFVNKSILKGTSGPATITKKIKLQVAVDSDKNITSCHALGGAIWSRGAGTDIYYNSGNVGIGTSTPTALLEVKGADASSASALPDTVKIVGAANLTTGGEGAPLQFSAGGSTNGATGGSIKILGGKSAAGGSIEITAGTNGGGGPGDVNILGASGGTGTNQDGGNVIMNPGTPGGSGVNGSVLLANLRGKVAVGTNTPVSSALLTVNGAIDTNNTPVILGLTTGNTRGDKAIDIQTFRNNQNQFVASGVNSVAIGTQNISSGLGSVAIGDSNNAGGTTTGSILIGQYNTATGSGVSIFGQGNNAVGGVNNVVIVGQGNNASGQGSVIFGRDNQLTAGSNQIALGFSNNISAANAMVFGKGVTNSIADSIQIGPNDAAKITLLSSGNVGIGTTTPAQKLDVAGNIQTNGCLYYPSGSLGSCPSDIRIKKDISPYKVGLKALLGLTPSLFKYNGLAGFKEDEKVQLGLIAQDVEKSAPELVKPQRVKLYPNDEKKTEIKSVDYGALNFVIINAIKDFFEEWLNAKESMDNTLAKLELEKDLLKKNAEDIKKENARINAELEKIEKLLK